MFPFGVIVEERWRRRELRRNETSDDVVRKGRGNSDIDDVLEIWRRRLHILVPRLNQNFKSRRVALWGQSDAKDPAMKRKVTPWTPSDAHGLFECLCRSPMVMWFLYTNARALRQHTELRGRFGKDDIDPEQRKKTELVVKWRDSKCRRRS